MRSTWNPRPAGLGLSLALAALVPGMVRAADEVAHRVELARTLVKAGETGRAESLLEGLTRARRDDPRAWLALGELRASLGAARGATYAFHRAGGLASQARRAKLAARLAAWKLPPLPPRHEIEDADEFLALAEGDACRDLARTGMVDPELACESGVPAPSPETWRLASPLVTRFAGDPRAWVRAQVVAHAPLASLPGSLAARVPTEVDSRVREAFLERMVQGAGELAPEAGLQAAVEACAGDVDFEVRARAFEWLHEAGRVPRVSPEDFAALTRRVDRGQASKALLRALFRDQPALLSPVLVEILHGRRLTGVVAALMVLALEGGRPGQLEVARAFARPGTNLGSYWGHAYQALTAATRDQGIELGRSPSQWLRALGE